MTPGVPPRDDPRAVARRRALGGLLREYREAKGIRSGAALARDLGLNQAVITSYERGDRSATVETVSRVAAALDVNLAVLLQQMETRAAVRGAR